DRTRSNPYPSVRSVRSQAVRPGYQREDEEERVEAADRRDRSAHKARLVAAPEEQRAEDHHQRLQAADQGAVIGRVPVRHRAREAPVGEREEVAMPVLVME